MSELKKSQYEPLLKDDLVCWRCGHVFKNMPTLKIHLQEEWDKEAKTERAKLERKRKREECTADSVQQGEPKRHETDVNLQKDPSWEYINLPVSNIIYVVAIIYYFLYERH